jgi:hypothetical protein
MGTRIGGHHERFDGTGYPRGLAGNDIPRAAGIVAIADSFEVMTAVRSYKKAMPLAEARAASPPPSPTHRTWSRPPETSSPPPRQPGSGPPY